MILPHPERNSEVFMVSSSRPSGPAAAGALLLIAAVVGATGAAFAYTAGWLSPHETTAKTVVASLAPPDGPALGHRRNHAKGICFTGTFDANGAGQELSSTAMFAAGSYPVIGRFNIASPDLKAADPTVRLRGMGLQIAGPGGQVWRMAMIDPPFFPVGTPQGFFTLLKTPKTDTAGMAAFTAAHPEFVAFGAWAKSAPQTASYAEEPYNSINSFAFTNASGQRSVVRWSFQPVTPPVPVSPDDMKKLGPDFLEQDITNRVQSGPIRWNLVVTVANPGDPTADPSKAWPADRHSVDVGTLTVRQIEAEPNGPCRDLVYDPTMLPAGMSVSDDPFPAARSSAYRRSYDLRSAEDHDYPRTTTEASR
jgi:catalase